MLILIKIVVIRQADNHHYCIFFSKIYTNDNNDNNQSNIDNSDENDTNRLIAKLWAESTLRNAKRLIKMTNRHTSSTCNGIHTQRKGNSNTKRILDSYHPTYDV